MSDKIYFNVEFAIKEGKLEEFKKAAEAIVSAVEKNEPDAISYNWFFNKDNSKCCVVEMWNDSEAILNHFDNVASLIPKLFEVSEITRFEVYGELSEEAKKAVAPHGAVLHSYWKGVSR